MNAQVPSRQKLTHADLVKLYCTCTLKGAIHADDCALKDPERVPLLQRHIENEMTDLLPSKNQLKRYRIQDNRGWQHAETECPDGPWVRYRDVEDDADRVYSDLAVAEAKFERLRAALQKIIEDRYMQRFEVDRIAREALRGADEMGDGT